MRANRFPHALLPFIVAGLFAVRASGQLVFIPDPNMRAFLEDLTGAVDIDGYLNTSDPGLSVDQVELYVEWENSDLTGIEYLTANELWLEYAEGLSSTTIPGWPANIGALTVIGAPVGELPAIPSTVHSLWVIRCSSLTALPALPAGLLWLQVRSSGITALPPLPADMVQLTLLTLPDLVSLPDLPDSLGLLTIGSVPLLSTLPAFPDGLYWIELDTLPALTALPAWPAALTHLHVNHVPQVTDVPALPPAITNLLFRGAPLVMSFPAIPPTVLELELGLMPQCAPSIPLYAYSSLTLDSLALTVLPDFTSIDPGLIKLKDLPLLTTVIEVRDSTGGALWLEAIPLSTLPVLPNFMRGIGFANLPGMTTLPAFPVIDPMTFGNGGISIVNMPDLMFLPPFPLTGGFHLAIHDCPQLHCLPPLTGLYYLEITGNTPISCLPNYTANVDEFIGFPLCGVLDSCAALNASISGTFYNDVNANGVRDVGEQSIPTAAASISPLGWTYGTDAEGLYSLHAPPGTFTITPVFTNPHLQAIVPLTHTAELDTYASQDSLNDFALQLTPNVQDLVLDVTWDPPQVGIDTEVWLTYSNAGTIPMSGSVSFTFDPVLTWVLSTPAPGSLIGQSANWPFTDLAIGESRSIRITLHTDVTVPLGTSVSFSAVVDPIATDYAPLDNVDSTRTVVVAPLDPNDKLVEPAVATPAEVQAGTDLEYTIRFQNTGTAYASRVVITDTLSSDLQWNTFQFVASSHVCTWFIDEGILHVVFDPIVLPDSASNQHDSHGFFKFRMRASTALMNGEQVENVANIYFDFNEPVITEPAIFLVDVTASVEEGTEDVLILYPNPAHDRVVLTGELPGLRWTLHDATGRVVQEGSTGTGRTTIQLAGLADGAYQLRVRDGEACRIGRIVKQ